MWPDRRSWLSLAVVVASCILQPAALAASWTLTTADFQSQPVQLQSLSGDTLTVTTPAGPQTVPVASVLQIRRDAPAGGSPAIKPAPFVLTLATGDRLTGSPTALEGETLTWSSASIGEMKVSVRNIRLLAKAGVPTPHDEPPAEDTLTLGNGDVVKGIVAGLSDGKWSVLQAGETLPVPVDSVARLAFASPGNPPASAAGRSFRVELADGSSLTAPSVEIAGDKATLKLADNTSRSVPLASVASVEQVNGPVAFLSSMTPAEDVQRPYLGEPWPARFNRGVTGDPLPKPFTRGIGVHAYSRLTFPVDPSYKTFRTQYAIDGGGPYANVTVRVLLDGKAAFEQENVSSTAPSKVLTLPLNGAKSITLEVDYGRSNDTQDRFVWLDPALLRVAPSAPATAPAPAPAPK